MNAEGKERELKFARVDLSALRDRLGEMEAEPQSSPSLENNWVFDRDDELGTSDRLLRLRICREATYLTFKGPSSFDGRTRMRQEHEVKVADADQIRAILGAIGFHAVRHYQKYREEWRLGSVLIALDHTPIGDFAELEGEGCERVAKRCGLDPEQAERRNYLRLYAAYLEEHPEAPPEMIFP
jgi:adenylate cyclase class 2